MLEDFPFLSEIPILSEYVKALYGIKGNFYPDHGASSFCYLKEKHLVKPNGSTVTREGFLDGTFGNISAVIFSNKHPPNLVTELYTKYEGSVTDLFTEHTEMIFNFCPDPEMESLEGMVYSDIFPNIRKLWYEKDNKIVLLKEGKKEYVNLFSEN
jgi:hypothetical protein